MEDEIIKIMNDLDVESTALLLNNIDIKINESVKRRIKNRVYTKLTMKKIPKRGRYRVPLIVAATMLVLVFTMGAGFYNGIAQYFGRYLIKNDVKPLSNVEASLLEQSGQMLQTIATGEGYSVELSAVVGDNDLMYGYVHVSADEGMSMDKSYRFKNCFVYLKEDADEKNTKGQYIIPEPLPDDKPDDNEINFIVRFEPYIQKHGERVNIEGKEVAINFQDLVECSNTGIVISDIANHDWEIPLTLNNSQVTQTLSFQDMNVPIEGCNYSIEKVRLSPLSLNIDGALVVTGNAQNWASIPIRVIYKDGTIVDNFYEDTFSTSTQDMPKGSSALRKNIIFLRPIDPCAVKSIMINGVEVEMTK